MHTFLTKLRCSSHLSAQLSLNNQIPLNDNNNFHLLLKLIYILFIPLICLIEVYPAVINLPNCSLAAYMFNINNIA